MVLSQYGRDLLSKKPKQKPPTKNSFTTKKQTMVSKEEVSEMIDFAINQHNRNAGQISMVLGFTFMALFADGLFRTLGLICLLYTSPSPRDKRQSRMPSSA